jgi:hypothetical protein
MKTLKQLLELKKPSPTEPYNKDSETSLDPKSFDEKRFKDKHVVNVKQDIAGNKDDVYKASNVKAYDRSTTRHGYDTNGDSKVYEEKQMKTLKQILGERHMTPAEKEKREDIAQGIEKSNPGMAMSKKMAIATSKAMKEDTQLDESESSAAAYDKYNSDCKKMVEHISKAIDQHSKFVKTKGDYGNGEPQWHHVDHMKNVHRTLQDMHHGLQQTNDYTAPPKTIKMKEEADSLFSVFADDIRDQVESVYESLDDEHKQIMIEMIEAEDYDTIIEVVEETING